MIPQENYPLLGNTRQQTSTNNLRMCCKCLKDEFKAVNFLFRHNCIESFYEAQWRWPYIIFVLYRIIVAVYTVTWLVLGIASGNELPFHWTVWLTNWSYTLLTCHLVVAAVITVYYSLKNKHFCFRKVHRVPITGNFVPANGTSGGASEVAGPKYNTPGVSSEGDVTILTPSDIVPWAIKISWLLYSTISSVAFIVTLVYFTALFPQISQGRPPSIGDLNYHGINSLIIAAEMILNGYPVRLLHFIYPTIFGAIYVVFSVIYWVVDHNNVLYPGVLDWNKPGQTAIVLCLLLFVIIPVLQLILFGAYKLKIYIYNKIYSS